MSLVNDHWSSLLGLSVWTTRPVYEEPEVILDRWTVVEVRGERHFVGYSVHGHEGRVSTAMETFDPATRRGVTASGRVYELTECPGHDPDGMWVLNVWLARQGITFEEVTELSPNEVLRGTA